MLQHNKFFKLNTRNGYQLIYVAECFRSLLKNAEEKKSRRLVGWRTKERAHRTSMVRSAERWQEGVMRSTTSLEQFWLHLPDCVPVPEDRKFTSSSFYGGSYFHSFIHTNILVRCLTYSPAQLRCWQLPGLRIRRRCNRSWVDGIQTFFGIHSWYRQVMAWDSCVL